MKNLMTFALGCIVTLSVGCFNKDSGGKSSKTPPKIPEKVTSLMLVDTQDGTGTEATAGKSVKVHYTGWLFDFKAPEHKGKKFDSSLDRKQTFSFHLGSGMVIKGWDKGVVGMKVGGKRRLFIPPEMGYGQRGAGNVIPPNSTLVFDVELIDVK